MNLFNENTKPINVLFVGGGRRVSLAKRFLEKGCRLFSYEVDDNCPISEVATIIKGLFWKDKDIISDLQLTCIKNNIDIVIPLQDEAIYICCGLNNVKCPADKDSSYICFDKLEFEIHMYDLPEYPIVYPSYNGKICLKPRFGFNSKGISIVESNTIKGCTSDFVAQQYIEGTEYSVDCYFDKESNLIGYVPRKRVAVQGGEVVQSITLNRNNPLYQKFGEFISRAFKRINAVGPYCIQFIENNGNIYIIEANARFGGGVILSLESGFDIIDLILKEYIYGIELSKEDPKWKEDFSMTRYFSEHFYGNTNTEFL